jgi:hypothetical protein
MFILLGFLPNFLIILIKTDECLDLTNQVKEKIFTDYNKLYREYLVDVIYARRQTKDPYISNIDLNNLRDSSVCLVNQRNHSQQVNEASMCPWVNKLKFRNNITLGFKYPEARVEAHCVCNKCNSLLSSSYECVPIVRPETCLERSKKCGPDGYWKWIPSIEMVTVACACSLVN